MSKSAAKVEEFLLLTCSLGNTGKRLSMK